MLVVTAAGCSDGGSGGGPAGTPLETRDFAFDPAQLSVPQGQQVTLNLRNTGEVVHNISIESIGADLDIAPGQTHNLIFVAPAGGDVAFFCKYHRDRGMTGTIAVR